LEKNVEMGATLANLFTTKVNTTANWSTYLANITLSRKSTRKLPKLYFR
jgi:hypothetical protein